MRKKLIVLYTLVLITALHPLHSFLAYGGSNMGIRKQKNTGYVYGYLWVDSKPASEYMISLVYDNDKKTDFVSVDKTGKYIIEMERGNHRIIAWGNRPLSGNKLLFSSKICYSDIPIEIEVKENEEIKLPDIRCLDPIVHLEPKNDTIIEEINPRFTWEPYPGAKTYEIIIYSVAGKWNRTSIAGQQGISTTSITYDSIESYLGIKKEPNLSRGKEYAWEIIAFDEKGLEVSRSLSAQGGTKFRIKEDSPERGAVRK